MPTATRRPAVPCMATKRNGFSCGQSTTLRVWDAQESRLLVRCILHGGLSHPRGRC